MSKRSNGEGSIFKRGDGKWCASKYIELPDGTVKRKYLYGKTQKEVRDKLKELENMDFLNEDSEMLFESWIVQWLDKYKKGLLKTTTYENYELTINAHIVGTKIGKTALNKLTTGLLQNYYNEKVEGINGSKKLSRRTVEYIRTIIGSALEQAYQNDLVRKNVNKATVLPRKEYSEIEPLTVEELNRIMQAAKEYGMYALIVTEIFTGMRRGEILALRWSDVDLQEGILYVRRNLCRIKNEDLECKQKTKLVALEPKTRKSIRSIPISETVIRALKTHKIEQYKQKMLKRDVYCDSDLVFSRINGEFEGPTEISRKFKFVLQKAEVRKCRFHDLRHSFASLLLNEGESLKVIQELLGHSTITTTMDVYSHLTTKTKRKSIDVLEKVVGQE